MICFEAHQTKPENEILHQQMILKNDPNSKVIQKTVE